MPFTQSLKWCDNFGWQVLWPCKRAQSCFFCSNTTIFGFWMKRQRSDQYDCFCVLQTLSAISSPQSPASLAAITALNCASTPHVCASIHPHLLVVFYPHAERIDEDGDHDPSVEVFTFHNPLQLLPEANPGPNHPVSVFQDAPPSAASSSASQVAALGNRWECQLVMFSEGALHLHWCFLNSSCMAIHHRHFWSTVCFKWIPSYNLTWGKSCSPSASPLPPSRSPSSSSKVSRLRAHKGQLSSSKRRGLGTTPANWNSSRRRPAGHKHI